MAYGQGRYGGGRGNAAPDQLPAVPGHRSNQAPRHRAGSGQYRGGVTADIPPLPAHRFARGRDVSHQRNRHRALGHQGQGARRTRVPAPRRPGAGERAALHPRPRRHRRRHPRGRPGRATGAGRTRALPSSRSRTSSKPMMRRFARPRRRSWRRCAPPTLLVGIRRLSSQNRQKPHRRY